MHEATAYAVLVTSCFLVPTWALTRGHVALWGDGGLLPRLRERLADHEPALDDDDLAVLAVWAYGRSRELSAALERLRLLLATDAGMSATRQLANRIAYAQVERDLRQMPEIVWPESTVSLSAGAGSVRTLPGRPDVELLDVGFSWR